MTIKLLYFSLLQDAADGTTETTHTISDTDTITVADLLSSLYEKHPALRPWDGKILVAADLEYVESDYLITQNQEIALMPPVQGG